MTRRVDAEGLRLHVRERPGTGPAVLLLHGWLDHGHGFDPLIEALPPRWHLVLLDFRGMGESAHLPAGAHYHFSDYLHDVEAALSGVGLAQVHLVGHSLGGLVAAMYAAARPERVNRLVLLESLGPSLGRPGSTVGRLRSFLEDLARAPHQKPYPSVEAAAERLRQSNPTLSPEAALLLARHGTAPLPGGGVGFRFDPRHRRHFGQGLNAEDAEGGDAQWLAVLRAVQAPALVIRATHGLVPDPAQDAVARARLAALRVEAPRVIPGGHHVHLDAPAEVARALEAFLIPSGPPEP
nr:MULTISPECIES: alpha/beta hydrolase [Myxococcaceae]